MKLSIIIPCYNEEEVLPLTLGRLNALSHEWIAREDCTEVEFVIVDDGSQDRTQELLVEVSKLEKQFKIIRFVINFELFFNTIFGIHSYLSSLACIT